MNRGAALPMVLLSLGIVGALAVGGAYVTRQFAGDSRIAQRAVELEPHAERVLVDAVASWDTTARGYHATGVTVEVPQPDLPGVSTRLWITRASSTVYWLVAEATGLGKPLLRRRLGMIVALRGGVVAPVATRAWSELP